MRDYATYNRSFRFPDRRIRKGSTPNKSGPTSAAPGEKVIRAPRPPRLAKPAAIPEDRPALFQRGLDEEVLAAAETACGATIAPGKSGQIDAHCEPVVPWNPGLNEVPSFAMPYCSGESSRVNRLTAV